MVILKKICTHIISDAQVDDSVMTDVMEEIAERFKRILFTLGSRILHHNMTLELSELDRHTDIIISSMQGYFPIPAMWIGEFVVFRGDFGQDLLRYLKEVSATPGMLSKDGGATSYHSK